MTYLYIYSLSLNAFALAKSKNLNRTAYLAQLPCHRTSPSLSKMYDCSLQMMPVTKLLRFELSVDTGAGWMDAPWMLAVSQVSPPQSTGGNRQLTRKGRALLTSMCGSSGYKYRDDLTFPKALNCPWGSNLSSQSFFL